MEINITPDLILQYHRAIANKESGFLSIRDFNNQISELGNLVLNKGKIYLALEIYKELGNTERIKKIVKIAIKNNHLDLAREGYAYLGDKKGLLEVIRKDGDLINYFFLIDYFGETKLEELYSKFKVWFSEKGYEKDKILSDKTHNIIDMAYNIREKYDLGIGIAKDGLYSAYIFSLFGLDVKILECHRKGKGATFKKVDNISEEDICNKQILVIDNDVVSGRTTRRVLKELKKFSPNKIDLILNYSPEDIGTKIDNISSDFNEVYYPKKFNYKNFDKAILKLEEILNKR